MTRLDPSGEPAREPAYRAAYRQLYDRIGNQDGCITFLLVELRALQKRVTKLEQRNDDLAAAALRLAHNNAQEVREMEQAPP
jgi:quinol monooxygenase YgiN